MSAPILPETLTRLLDCKPEPIAARMVRELGSEPGVGGATGLAILTGVAAFLGAFLATGGKF